MSDEAKNLPAPTLGGFDDIEDCTEADDEHSGRRVMQDIHLRYTNGSSWVDKNTEQDVPRGLDLLAFDTSRIVQKWIDKMPVGTIWVTPNERWLDVEKLNAEGPKSEAREELENAFEDVSDELIKAAVAEIETDGDEWAPAGSRMQPEPESELVTAKRRLAVVLDNTAADAASARFSPQAVALVLSELYCLQMRLAGVKRALDHDSV
jgi:hypothetical protein